MLSGLSVMVFGVGEVGMGFGKDEMGRCFLGLV